MYIPTIEDRLTKLEDELSSLNMWTKSFEEEMDMTLAEIEKRLGLLEKENVDGR